MKLNWEFLLGPILLLVLALIAGTLWPIVPVQTRTLPETVPAGVAAPAPPTPQPRPLPQAAAPDALDRDRAMLLKTAQTVKTDWDKTERSLKSVSDEQQRVFLSIQREQRRLEDFKSGLGALDQKQAALRTEAEKSVEALRLEGLLLTKKVELARLETEFRDTRNPFEREITSLPRALPATKVPVLVELFRERAIPVDKKHFHFDVPKFSGPSLATRIDIGETAEEIKNPASYFNRFLDGIKTNKQYLACLLNDDSFDIFREVRSIAKAKGIAVGWEPIDSSAGKITIYPVHFVKGSEKVTKTEKGKTAPRVAAIIE